MPVNNKIQLFLNSFWQLLHKNGVLYSRNF
uniref:Uncharacterized protein n=1 Tax=Enterococcus phage PMBT56 TaxID=3229530 RepID=A0AB39C696_9CAUD